MRNPEDELLPAMNQLASKFVNLSRELGDVWERLAVFVDTGYDFGQETRTLNTTLSQPSQDTPEPKRYMLWIDGVGNYLLCLGEQVTFGGPRSNHDSADVSLLANLSRRHATLIRGQEGYLIEAHSPVEVAGRGVDHRAFLNDGYRIDLGAVGLEFRIPSVLSSTAVLNFLSDHRPAQNVDGIILMDETCLLGSGRENHVRCPDWNDSVLLYRQQGRFHVKCHSDMFIAGKLATDNVPLLPGDVATGNDFRFRIEALDTGISSTATHLSGRPGDG